ncbi:glycoside hydrolase family 24 protein [Rhizobium mesoamericanum]|uniref:Putative Lysozyme n=1 Tax=Rhizobium mesoamericanum STM3625 TaxID=1211777 RepID=K0PZA2_9HYPH|nr:glycoside hydrolase family 104 protein [Rhizobium mesoamericanum]CCM77130.1 putative Lysozyme [Rhizobium mesoamericanum STM3625]
MASRREYYSSLRSNPNVQRALASIRAAEGTARYTDPYSVGFGGRQIGDLSQHPGTMSAFSDLSGNRKKTSAAGAYQFLDRTWGNLSGNLGLRDFGPESQDIAAIGLLDQSGALDNVLAGDVNGFVNDANGTWASLPGSPYNQPTRTRAFINSAWNNYTPLADIPDNAPTPTSRPPDLEGILSADYSAPVSSVQRSPLKDVDMRVQRQPTMQTVPDLMYDRFATTPFDASRFAAAPGATGKNALRRGLLDQQLDAGILPSLDNPAYAAMQQPDYVDPTVTSAYAEPASIKTAAVQAPPAFDAQSGLTGGLLSPQEQRAVAAQRAYLDQQPFNKAPSQFGNKAREAAGSILGAVLGGLTLGPVGAIGGGLLGNVVTRPGGILGSEFPDKPKSQSRGDGSLTDYGRSVANSSSQFSRALSSGGKGLY